MPTIITAFMVDRSRNRKTFGELATIFESCYASYANDVSNDLRILKFSADMANGRWRSDVLIKRHNRVATDGIHRGIAYLLCAQRGSSVDDLPRLLACDGA